MVTHIEVIRQNVFSHTRFMVIGVSSDLKGIYKLIRLHVVSKTSRLSIHYCKVRILQSCINWIIPLYLQYMFSTKPADKIGLCHGHVIWIVPLG